MKNWIDELVLQHSELESPKSFWMWAGLAAISAVIKDNVWLDRGGAYKLYPNLYVILHAESGLKKGPPISLAKDLVRMVNNTRVISGRSSIQGILKKLGTAYTVPGGKVINKSVGFICSSELSSSLVEDTAALTILTDLYDRQYNEGEWESLLKMENFQLKDPTVSLLGGINDAHAEAFFGKKDIQGGFLARTFIIYEKEEQNINALVRRLTHPPNKIVLAEHLKEIAKLVGPFKDLVDEHNNPTPVGKFYEEWYNNFRAEVKRMEIKDETGTLNRFGDSVLKVAMLLSLSKTPKLEIDMDSMERAVTISERLIGNIRQTTMGKRGMSSSAQLKALIIKELLERDSHQVSRIVLMKKMWLHYSDSNEFDNLMQGFDAAGLIKTNSIGNQIIYTMPEKQVEELKHFLAGKVGK